MADQELCGTSIWTLEPTDRLAATATGREYADRRELRVYATADVAVREMTALGSHLRDCSDESAVGGGRLVHATFGWLRRLTRRVSAPSATGRP
ncbi:MAG: hypothetical protein ABIQ15_17760 [Nocardioides sp.]